MTLPPSPALPTALYPLYDHQRKQLVSARAPDIKLGEQVLLPAKGQDLCKWLEEMPAPFALLGISEDIGVRANQGRPGTGTAWEPFLSAFFNMQANHCLSGKEIALIGNYAPTKAAPAEGLDVKDIDREVSRLAQAVFKAKKRLIVIGGGHNNAYPLLAACRHALGRPSHVLNLDAHPDFRNITSGAHSGNPFSRAREDAYLGRYALLGYHSAYMPAYIYERFKDDDNTWLCSYEDLFVYPEVALSFSSVLRQACAFLQASHLRGKKEAGYALELDIDSLAFAESSARSPAGFSLDQGRAFVCNATRALAPHYFHLCEARIGKEDPLLVGKRLAYLVHDFLRTACL